jgi:hypothetical protein
MSTRLRIVFWAEAINTACHAIIGLYLHKLRHKTAYELLTGKKLNVSYFTVFGCKRIILNKKPKSSKFAPKVDEGIFLGYASNTHGYRVVNKTFGCVEVTCDLTFDESNGSQVEQVDEFCVGKDVPAGKAIKKMAIGEVKPQEEDDEDCEIEESAISPPAVNPEYPEIPGFPETPEIISETLSLLLMSPKAVKKLRN